MFQTKGGRECSLRRMGRANQDTVSSFELETKGGRQIHCLGLFDGHGAHFFSSYLRDFLPAALQKEILSVDFEQPLDVQRAVIRAFYLLDRRVHDLLLECWLSRDFSRLDELGQRMQLESSTDSSYFHQLLSLVDSRAVPAETAKHEYFSRYGGSTAVLSLQRGKRLYLVNLGDSRAMYMDPASFSYTIDHKPGDPEEARRIKEAGGFVAEGRVGGMLALSRAFGDYVLKYVGGRYDPYGPVSVMPDVYPLEAGQGCVLLASDGLVDVIESEEIYALVQSWTGGDFSRAPSFCQGLVEEALKKYEAMGAPSFEIDDISLWLARTSDLDDEQKRERKSSALLGRKSKR